MRAAFMTDVNVVEVRDDAEEPELDPARRAAAGRGVRHLRHRRAHLLQRRPEGARRRGSSGTSRSACWRRWARRRTCRPGVAAGDRVFLGSILTCGECRWCAEGFQNLCEHHLLYGYDPYPGAYAELAAVPPIATKNLIPLPPELPSRPRHRRGPVRVRAERHRAARRAARRHRRDPRDRSDRLLAGGDGPRPRRIEGLPHRRLR